MPTTTTLGYPVPLDSDPVEQGAEATRNLGQAVDDRLGVAARGASSVAVTASTTGTLAVVFPAGRFTNPPMVVATANGSSVWMAYAQSVTAAGFTLGVRQVQGTSTTTNVTVHWIALEQ